MTDGVRLLIQRRRQGSAARKLSASAATTTAPRSKRVQRQSQPRQASDNPLIGFLLLAGVALFAVLIGRISDSNLNTLTIFVFGCRATGLISEDTLVKILSRGRKR